MGRGVERLSFPWMSFMENHLFTNEKFKYWNFLPDKINSFRNRFKTEQWFSHLLKPTYLNKVLQVGHTIGSTNFYILNTCIAQTEAAPSRINNLPCSTCLWNSTILWQTHLCGNNFPMAVRPPSALSAYMSTKSAIYQFRITKARYISFTN